MKSQASREQAVRATRPLDFEVEWVNFRGFQDTGKVVFRPLTILIGANNVGKSSLVAPLLLLSQTISSRDSITPFVTRGRLLDYGIFRDNIYHQDLSRDLDLSVSFKLITNVKRKPKKIGSYPPGVLRVVLGLSEDRTEILLKEFHLRDTHNRPYIKRLLQKDGSYSLEGIPLDTLDEQEKEAIKRSKPTNFVFSPNHLLYCYSSAGETPDGSRKSSRIPSMTKDFSHYLQITAFSFETVRSFFTGITYIGPLRDRPCRHYEFDSEVPVSVGPRGEFTANLLRRKSKDRAFKLRVDKWIKKFEFGDKIHVQEDMSDIFSVSFKKSSPNRTVNIADSGFGASQVLPLIVQALAGREGTLTIAEQPEIHLNPRLQTVLADLFVEMANTNKRVIVETHSEHLLLRLRRLVAEGVISSDKVAVYFVENGDDGSTVREIPVTTEGHIAPTDWPRGFFAETLQESLALAAAQAKNLSKKAPYHGERCCC